MVLSSILSLYQQNSKNIITILTMSIIIPIIFGINIFKNPELLIITFVTYIFLGVLFLIVRGINLYVYNAYTKCVMMYHRLEQLE